MPRAVLSVFDTQAIQAYVFGSNVLRENVGASELVRQATNGWPYEILDGMCSNIHADKLELIRDNLDAELVYCGGGNCVILSATQEIASKIAFEMSRRAIERAPGLQLVVAHVAFDWCYDTLAAKVHEAHEQLAEKKRSGGGSASLLGLGVTLACRATGLPAVGIDLNGACYARSQEEPPRALSAEVLAKLQAVCAANCRLKGTIEGQLPENMEIPSDFDQLGRTRGVNSYLGVVHADGNGMGRKIEQLADRFPAPAQNRDYINAMRAFSKAIEEGSESALQKLVVRLLACYCYDGKEGVIQGWLGQIAVPEAPIRLYADKNTKRPHLPLRPLIYGGDDLTFVCDGRLALSLAAAYLKLFKEAMAEQVKSCQWVDGMQASAGVSIVKVHYPFSAAYKLAEELCGNAKRVSARRFPALDWHIAQSGLFGSLSDMREVECETSYGHLELRPVALRQAKGGARSWEALTAVMDEFLTCPEWSQHRTRRAALETALRHGPTAVQQFLRGAPKANLLPLADAKMAQEGWACLPDLQGNAEAFKRCGYADALEALEFYVPLTPKED